MRRVRREPDQLRKSALRLREEPHGFCVVVTLAISVVIRFPESFEPHHRRREHIAILLARTDRLEEGRSKAARLLWTCLNETVKCMRPARKAVLLA